MPEGWEILAVKGGGHTLKRTLFLWFLLPLWAGAQTPSCQFKSSDTAIGPFTAPGVKPANPGFANNTGAINCNVFVATWNTTGFSAISLQLEGSDDGITFTAYSNSGCPGTTPSCVVPPAFSNPSTTLSGTIVVQTNSKNARVHLKLNSATGAGQVNFQVYGFNNVSPVAASGTGSGGGSTSWANITPGTNNKGFMQVQSPTIIEPTAISGGGIYATQMVDANDLPAVTITTPGGPAIDLLNVATSVGGGGAKVTVAAIGSDSNVGLDLRSKGTSTLTINGNCAFDPSGNVVCPGQITSGLSSGAAGGIALVQGTGLSTTPNAVTITVPTSVTPYLYQIPGAAPAGAVSVLASATSGVQSWYNLTTTNGSTKVASATGTPATGNCATWSNGNLADAGFPCGSGSGGGGGIVSFSGNAGITLASQYAALDGSATSATEVKVQAPAPTTATLSNMRVSIESAAGGGISFTFVLRVNGVNQPITCTITDPATSCNDLVHSVSVAGGDLVNWAYNASSGSTTRATNIALAWGTSGVGITSVTATAPLTSSGGTTPNISGTYNGNGTKIQLFTGSAPTTNDCAKFDANGNVTGAGQSCQSTSPIASGTAALGTSAISSGSCASVVTVSAVGTLTTDNISADFNADPTGVTGYSPSASGMLTIIKYPTADNVNFKVCNNTSASITPGAITLNWRVLRSASGGGGGGVAHGTQTCASSTCTVNLSGDTTFAVTISTAITAASLSGGVAGQTYSVSVCQDSTGSRAWPQFSNLRGAMLIGSTASTCNTQNIYYDGSTYLASSNGIQNQ